MKTTLKMLLVLALFSTAAMADGNQGSGGSPVVIEPTKTPAIEVVISVFRQYFGLGF